MNPFGTLYPGQFALSAVWVFNTDQWILRQSAPGKVLDPRGGDTGACGRCLCYAQALLVRELVENKVLHLLL